jgi:hypothetical protein
VIRVVWAPEGDERQVDDDLHARFLGSCVKREEPSRDGNLAAWIHGKLVEKPEPHD